MILRYTYDFLVIHFQTTDDKVHGLLSFTICLIPINISLMWLVGRAL